jgi:hypothetical protein
MAASAAATPPESQPPMRFLMADPIHMANFAAQTRVPPPNLNATIRRQAMVPSPIATDKAFPIEICLRIVYYTCRSWLRVSRAWNICARKELLDLIKENPEAIPLTESRLSKLIRTHQLDTIRHLIAYTKTFDADRFLNERIYVWLNFTNDDQCFKATLINVYAMLLGSNLVTQAFYDETMWINILSRAAFQNAYELWYITIPYVMQRSKQAEKDLAELLEITIIIDGTVPPPAIYKWLHGEVKVFAMTGNADVLDSLLECYFYTRKNEIVGDYIDYLFSLPGCNITQQMMTIALDSRGSHRFETSMPLVYKMLSMCDKQIANDAIEFILDEYLMEKNWIFLEAFLKYPLVAEHPGAIEVRTYLAAEKALTPLELIGRSVSSIAKRIATRIQTNTNKLFHPLPFPRSTKPMQGIGFTYNEKPKGSE